MNEVPTLQLIKNDSFVKSLSSKFIVTSILSVFAVYAGSLIDTMFVGLFLGEKGLSAISLVGPVYLFYYTLGSIIGIGGANAASVFIGREDYKGYRAVFTVSTIAMAIACIPMTVLGFVFIQPIAHMLGGSGASAELVASYLKYYIVGGAFTMLSYIPLYFLKTDGRPRASTMLFLLSSCINVALTWLFMSPICNMGIGGAALATSISMGVTSVVGFWIILRSNGELKFIKDCFKLETIKKILVMGLPNGLTNLFESTRILLINLLLIRLGAALLLPTFTVIRNVIELISSVMFGVSAALMPLVGVFYGERDNASLRSSLQLAVRVGLYIVTPLTLLVSIFPDVVSGFFGITDALVLAENRIAIPLACAGLLAAHLNIVYIGYCSIVKRSWLANLLVFMRLMLYLAFFAMLLGGALGTTGIWLSFTLTELATLLSYAGIRHWLRKREPKLDEYLVSSADVSTVDVSFSVRNRVEDIVLASERILEFCEQSDISMQQSTMVGLALEELLSVIIVKCMDGRSEQSIDLRVCKINNEVMMRIRNTGKIFDPVSYYHNNKGNPDMMEELLGLQMIISKAKLIDFRQTFGVNNLLVMF